MVADLSLSKREKAGVDGDLNFLVVVLVVDVGNDEIIQQPKRVRMLEWPKKQSIDKM